MQTSALRKPAADPHIAALFVPVPETTLPGGLVVPPFEVAQYSCSKGDDGKLVINADGIPWHSINYNDAINACAESGFQLERNSQRLALAYQIASLDENWTGRKVGSGKLFQGLRKGGCHSPQKGHITASTDPDERRWFALPGGHRIYDVAGNIYNWVFDDIDGDTRGIVSRKFSAESPSIVIPFPAEDKGQGWTPRPGTDWSGGALVRGGYWCSESDAGVFRLNLVWPDGRGDYVGFRCTKPIGR